jgi:hypothetical protein
MLDNWIYWESPRSQMLAWLLSAGLALHVLYLFIVGIAIADHPQGNPGGYLLINGGLLVVKVSVIMALIRGLKKRKVVACYVVIAMAVAALVFVALNFKPERDMRRLGLETIQYGVNVLNLALACMSILLSVLAIREIKAIKSKPEEERLFWKTSV